MKNNGDPLYCYFIHQQKKMKIRYCESYIFFMTITSYRIINIINAHILDGNIHGLGSKIELDCNFSALYVAQELYR